MKITKKISAILLSAVMIASFFSVFCTFASAEEDAVFGVEAKKSVDYKMELVVYGKNMKNTTGWDILLYYDNQQLELKEAKRSFIGSIGSTIVSDDEKIHYSVYDDNIENDESIILFTCYFYPLEEGEIQLELKSVDSDRNEKIFDIKIDTTDYPITYVTDEYRYVVENEEAMIVDVLDVVDETGIVTIPEKLDGVPVVRIKNHAFENTAYMLGVIIPETIDMVSFSVFKDCYSLEWIEVQGENTVFGSQSFGSLGSHVAVFGGDDYEVAKSAADAGLRYFSEKIQKGDINADGYVNSVDARLTLRISSGIENKCTRAEVYADMNKDGVITAADARILLRISAKLESIEVYK